ncbi:group II intron reverse transcriptase/maturase [Roseofilum capinflatum]|uniref:Reverse transcriptase domain-containing protein n=1 Tax=Roseofilum capinflatum BLCC-M114 TaxID=3022440 RepID=A0ABT7B5J3_9CYAN|nr:reverse transcriptase domain-containing protein [Roseofilum capinflatum]MDJ1173899.1 reverse transcriptase domain-containing protein [Roseofilum capinflatum BLCC-M114]
MNTNFNSMYEWRDIDWRKVERCVFKLQKRIFKASQQGNVKLVHRLQRLLINSWYGKLMAARRVSQDNQGKKTAGIDGVKSLSPKQRLILASNLNLSHKAKPTRRVLIPKPGTNEKRPLGIPTMEERALQALVKQAMEPEWEAKFEPNSYGFRPGRSAHDAIGAIFSSIKQKAKYVLDADIAKCFDKINHEKLLDKLQTYPTLRRQVKAWLKSGVIQGNSWFPTNEGTPQGGVISPLLANIALHGMEEKVKQFAETLPGNKMNNQYALSLIRYADDFVILHKDEQVIRDCSLVIRDWLAEMGLELKPSKTRITHTKDGDKDLNFLGFNIAQYQMGKNHSGKSPKGERLGFKTLIKPNKDKVKAHIKKLGEVIARHKSSPIVRHVKVKGMKSPYDGELTYWSSRMGKHPEMPNEKAALLKKQKGKCNYCGQYFRDGDLMEIDHVIPKALGGSNRRENKQLLHRHCHDRKTAAELISIRGKNRSIEEPDEVKVSRPVLKTSRTGDCPA